MKKIAIRVADDETVPGYALSIRGGIALLDRAGQWNLTHVRSGAAIGFFPSREAALACRTRLLRLTDWTVPTARLMRRKRVLLRAQTIRAEHGGNASGGDHFIRTDIPTPSKKSRSAK